MILSAKDLICDTVRSFSRAERFAMARFEPLHRVENGFDGKVGDQSAQLPSLVDHGLRLSVYLG